MPIIRRNSRPKHVEKRNIYTKKNCPSKLALLYLVLVPFSLLRILRVSWCPLERLPARTRAQNIVKEIKHYQEKWLQHVQRMDTNRLPKQALQYKLKGRRNVGRPRKRWKEQLHLEDQGTGNLNLHEYDDDDDETQLFAVNFISLQGHSTCFGSFPHPSSGVH